VTFDLEKKRDKSHKTAIPLLLSELPLCFKDTICIYYHNNPANIPPVIMIAVGLSNDLLNDRSDRLLKLRS